MSGLESARCEACRKDAPRLNDAEIAELMPEVRGWSVDETDGEKRLVRIFKFDNFADALDFTNKIGALAEDNAHHPAILTEWGKVTVSWWTHKINGLHRNDFIMAARTNAVMNSVSGGLSDRTV